MQLLHKLHRKVINTSAHSQSSWYTGLRWDTIEPLSRSANLEFIAVPGTVSITDFTGEGQRVATSHLYDAQQQRVLRPLSWLLFGEAVPLWAPFWSIHYSFNHLDGSINLERGFPLFWVELFYSYPTAQSVSGSSLAHVCLLWWSHTQSTA